MKLKKLFSNTSSQHSFNNNNNSYITKSTSLVMLLICCLCLFSPLVTAYNIDIPSYIKHQRLEPNTMFGFSIALHKGRAGPHTNS